MRKLYLRVIMVFVMTVTLCAGSVSGGNDAVPSHYEPYLDLIDQVYQAMVEEYHYPVSEPHYRAYRQRYKDSILSQVPPVPRIDSIAYRGAGMMVMQLRHADDTFTNFVPPREAKEISKAAYGHRQDIGITGTVTEKGYLIDHVEIRSDSYISGIRPGFLIIEINGVNVLELTPEEIADKLEPEIDTEVFIKVMDPETGETIEFNILSLEYYRETVRRVPTEVPGVYCLVIRSFNRETAEDLKDHVADLKKMGLELLILDIRGNPGGPPLAVREMAGIFFPPETKLAYYQKQQSIVGGLMAPQSEVRYEGPLALIVDSRSGSSSELLVAILQEYGRGQVVGKDPTAGFSFLKGLREFEDGSMLIMATGFAYLFNGKQLAFDGIPPSYTAPEDVEDLVEFTATEFKKGNLFDEKGRPVKR